jgi:glyoxylase-like metal-dependent hydrolase (beta-lactamase superfamily II)
MAEYRAVQLEEDIWAIEEGFVRSYLILGQKDSLLIDAGFAASGLDEFVRSITPNPVTLFLTHADHDHIGCSHLFENILMHPDEYTNYLNQARVEHLDYTPIEDGHQLLFDGREMQVIHLPGHTPGSLLLYDREHGYLFSGDTIADSAIYLFGQERNIKQYIDSLRRLEALHLDIRWIFPSHGRTPVEADLVTDIRDGIELIADGTLPPIQMMEEGDYHLYQWKRAQFYI